MEIIYKKLKDLVPYGNNPRDNVGAVAPVAESIKTFGFLIPIVITPEGVIVCGHTRYLAAKQLRRKEVPCVIADDLTEEQIRAYRLADNKTAELAGWDMEKLAEELSGISMGMEVFGFDMRQELEEDMARDIEQEEKPKEIERVICPRCGKIFEVEA